MRTSPSECRLLRNPLTIIMPLTLWDYPPTSGRAVRRVLAWCSMLGGSRQVALFMHERNERRLQIVLPYIYALSTRTRSLTNVSVSHKSAVVAVRRIRVPLSRERVFVAAGAQQQPRHNTIPHSRRRRRVITSFIA